MPCIRIVSVLALCAAVCSGQVTLIKADKSVTSYTSTQLQNALNAANCGSIVEIDTAANPSTVTIPNLGCTVWPGLLIRASRHYKLDLSKLVTSAEFADLGSITATDTSNTPIIQTAPGASYIRFFGLDVYSRNTSTVYNMILFGQVLSGQTADSTIDSESHHIVLDHCRIRGVSGWSLRNGIVANTGLFIMRNSIIDDVRTGWSNGGPPNADGSESHGLVASAGRGPWILENNSINAGHINALWGGVTHALPGQVQQWAIVRNNRFWRKFKWMQTEGTQDPSGACPYDSEDGNGALHNNTTAGTYWHCVSGTWTSVTLTEWNNLVTARLPTPDKNLFEFKDMKHGLVEGNIFERSYGWNYQSQVGACILINTVDYVGASDTLMPWSQVGHVNIRNNICRDAPAGLTFGRLQIQGLSYTPGNPTVVTLAGNSARFLVSGRTYLTKWSTCMTQAPRVVTVVDSSHISIAGSSTSGCTGNQYVIMGSDTWVPVPQYDISVENNLFLYGDTKYTNPTFGDTTRYFLDNSFVVQLGGMSLNDFRFRHNTAWNYSTRVGARYNAVNLAGGNSIASLYPSQVSYPRGVSLTDNMMSFASGWWDSAEGGSTSVNSLNNTLGKHALVALNTHADNQNVGSSAYNDNLVKRCVAGALDCPYDSTSTNPPSNCRGCPLIANGSIAASFSNVASQDFTLTSTNPGYRAASDGLDTGYEKAMLDKATQGVSGGTANSYLEFKITEIVPTATTLALRYRAPDLSACTVEARGFGFSDSAAVASSTDSGGQVFRTATLSGLSSGKQYGLKITCGSAYIRENGRTL